MTSKVPDRSAPATSLVIERQGQLLNSVHSRLYGYWDQKRQDGAMPARTDLNPSDVVPLLPHLVLIDTAPDTAGFVFRLAGTAVVREHGEELTGTRVAEAGGDEISVLLGQFRLVAVGKKPRFFAGPYRNVNGVLKHSEWLILPLSSDSRSVDILACAVDFSRMDYSKVR